MDATFGDYGIERRWARGAAKRSSLVSGVLAAMLLSTLFLTRFALTVGKSELSLALVVVLAGTAVMAMTGAVRVSPTRAALFTIAVATLLLALMLGAARSRPMPRFSTWCCSMPHGCSSCPTTGNSPGRSG